MTELMRASVNQADGSKALSVRLLQRFGQADPYLTPEKLQELWVECSQHDTLFSDHTKGDVGAFFDVMFSPRSIIAEVFSFDDNLPIGLLMLTDVLPHFDAKGHFTFWDSHARGREPLLWAMMNLWMSEFDLHRMSVQVPGVQSGVIRMVKRLGFVEEGVMREGTLHQGKWIDLNLFGITREELQEKMKDG